MKRLSNILSLSRSRVRNRYRRGRRRSGLNSNNSNNNNNSNNSSNNSNNNSNNNNSNNEQDFNITSDEESSKSGNSSDRSSILHRTVKNAHHNTKYSSSSSSDIENSDDSSSSSEYQKDENNIKLKKLKKSAILNLKDIDLDLLLQDDIYDQVEDDVLNTLLNYTTEEDLKKFRKYLRRKEKRESSTTSSDIQSAEEEDESTSDYSTESKEREEEEEEEEDLSQLYYEDDFGIHEYSSDYALNKNDIESNRQVLKDSLASSILRRKPSRKPSTISPPLSPHIESTTPPKSPLSYLSPLSTSTKSISQQSSSTTTTPKTTTTNLKESIKIKAKMYLIPPKLLMQMDDVEMIREDICAIDRSLAGYIRTGLSITGLGIALLQRLGATTKTLIVSIIFFAYGLSLIIIGLRRHKVIITYTKKGYMKPSVISILLVTIFTIIIVGFSYYVIS